MFDLASGPLTKITCATLRFALGCGIVAIAAQYVFLGGWDLLLPFERSAIPVLIGTLAVLLVILLARESALLPVAYVTLTAAAIYLIIGIRDSLASERHPIFALYYFIWLPAPYLLAAVVLHVRHAQLYCWGALILSAVVVGVWTLRDAGPVDDGILAYGFLQVGLSQIATLALLLVHSVARERAGADRTRMEMLERNAAALQRAAAVAEQARARAEAADRAKSHFLMNMNHELRTPLNAIIGFADMMREEVLGAHGHPQYRQYARDIGDSGRRLLALINQVLELSEIRDGTARPSSRRTDLSELVAGIAEGAAPAAAAAGVALRADPAGEPAAATADPDSLRRIMEHLVRNALAATPRGGEVEIGTRPEGDGWVSLYVRDSGRGIPPQHLDRVTEPFWRLADPHRADGAGGAGLGLPIARSLAEMMGGELVIDSVPARGTTARVRLPAASREPAAAERTTVD